MANKYTTLQALADELSGKTPEQIAAVLAKVFQDHAAVKQFEHAAKWARKSINGSHSIIDDADEKGKLVRYCDLGALITYNNPYRIEPNHMNLAMKMSMAGPAAYYNQESVSRYEAGDDYDYKSFMYWHFNNEPVRITKAIQITYSTGIIGDNLPPVRYLLIGYQGPNGAG
jgi:hypothetical protein